MYCPQRNVQKKKKRNLNVQLSSDTDRDRIWPATSLFRVQLQMLKSVQISYPVYSIVYQAEPNERDTFQSMATRARGRQNGQDQVQELGYYHDKPSPGWNHTRITVILFLPVLSLAMSIAAFADAHAHCYHLASYTSNLVKVQAINHHSMIFHVTKNRRKSYRT